MWHLVRWSIILCVGGCAGRIPARVHHERVRFARAAAGSGRLRSVFKAEQHSSAWVGIQSFWTCGVSSKSHWTTTCQVKGWGPRRRFCNFKIMTVLFVCRTCVAVSVRATMSGVLAKDGCEMRNVEQHERGNCESFPSRGILKLCSQCMKFFE